MNIIILILLVFLLIISLCSLYRQWSYQKLLQEEGNPEFKKNVRAYRPLLHEKQLFVLLVVNVLLIFSLALSVFSIFRLENGYVQLQKMTQTYYQNQEKRLQILEAKDKKESPSIPKTSTSKTSVSTSINTADKNEKSTSSSQQSKTASSTTESP